MLYQPYRTAEQGTDSFADVPHHAELALHKGARVLATDGEVGKIDELVIDPETHRVAHLVLRWHNLTNKQLVTIPISKIERAEMDFVNLKIDKAEVKELPTEKLKRFHWE